MAKAAEAHDVEVKGADVSWSRAPDYRSIYTNVMAIAATAHDVQIRLGQTIALPDGHGATHSETATLLMPPAQAKALVVLLTRAVSDWEEKYKQKLPLPPHLQKRLDEEVGKKQKGKAE